LNLKLGLGALVSASAFLRAIRSWCRKRASRLRAAIASRALKDLTCGVSSSSSAIVDTVFDMDRDEAAEDADEDNAEAGDSPRLRGAAPTDAALGLPPPIEIREPRLDRLLLPRSSVLDEAAEAGETRALPGVVPVGGVVWDLAPPVAVAAVVAVEASNRSGLDKEGERLRLRWTALDIFGIPDSRRARLPDGGDSDLGSSDSRGVVSRPLLGEELVVSDVSAVVIVEEDVKPPSSSGSFSMSARAALAAPAPTLDPVAFPAPPPIFVPDEFVLRPLLPKPTVEPCGVGVAPSGVCMGAGVEVAEPPERPALRGAEVTGSALERSRALAPLDVIRRREAALDGVFAEDVLDERDPASCQGNKEGNTRGGVKLANYLQVWE